ncbi:MAG TPA: S41 family peptidase [Elusimicrobiales bacterium]|nr:S41 family peptidase [Elusimicrobiales bacterium]
MKHLRKLALISLVSALIGLAFPYVNFAIDQTYQQLKVIVDVMELIRENYVDEVGSQKLIYGAAAGMVRELDDFSQFMEPDVYTRVKSDTEGEFGGIGIRVDQREGWLTVVTPLPNTPAWRAELYPGDKIIKIEGESTKDLIIDDAIKKLRGTPGTKVTITISREPEDKSAEWITRDVPLVREIIKTENVKSRVIDGKIGYIKAIEFTGHVVEDFTKALEDLKKQGIESLIIDLRYNPGGLLSGSVDISKLFLDNNKMIVYTKGRRAENYQEFRASSRAPYSDLPLVILVNRYSASASEIVSGAMQDNKRAVVIGERTYGKASVQSMIPLSDKSALRLTIAKYYTPSGRSIHRDEKNNTGGITPDIEVKMPVETEKKLLQQAEEFYYPGKPEGKDGKGVEKKKEPQVRDEVLERGVEILKARDVLVNLKVQKQ